MSKYHQNYDKVSGLMRDGKASWGMLIKKIKPESRILEFGCASGHMTRYLHEELGCQVFGIDINPDDAKQAQQYAAEVFVGDVEEFEWVEALGERLFDVILFADILEHLKDPRKVLESCHRFLASDGRILASIPNIAHNSVMIELWENRLDYRSVGLLDNTHLRLFSASSVRAMFRSVGLEIQSFEYTRLRPERTEFRNSLKELPWTVRWGFSRRPFANAYQFIIEASFSNT